MNYSTEQCSYDLYLDLPGSYRSHLYYLFIFLYPNIIYIYKKKMVTFFLLLVCYKFRNTIPEHRERIRMKCLFFSGISFFVIDCVAIILLTVSLHTHARVTKLNTIQTVKCCYSHVPIFYFFFSSQISIRDPNEFLPRILFSVSFVRTEYA